MGKIALEEIYNRYISRWPATIAIDDGVPTQNGAFVLPNLARVHAEIEKTIDNANDHWGNIFTWSMFQACCEFGKLLAERGVIVMAPQKVPLELIDKYLVFNLQGPDWSTERAQYGGFGS